MEEGARRRELAELWSTIWAYLYVQIWVKRTNLRYYLERGAIGVLAASLLLLALDVALELYGRHMATSPVLAVRIAFFVIIVFALYTKLREWSDRGKAFFFVQTCCQALRLIAAKEPLDPAGDTVETLLGVFSRTFGRKGVINATVALPRDDGRLELRYVYPSSVDHDFAFTPLPGEGGAGYAFEHRCLVYVPRTRYRHAILQEMEKDGLFWMVPDLFVPGRGKRLFRSVLSVPLLLAHGRCIGVLNFDSRKGNAFRRLDFQQAMFYGFVLAQVLLRFGAEGMGAPKGEAAKRGPVAHE